MATRKESLAVLLDAMLAICDAPPHWDIGLGVGIGLIHCAASCTFN